MSHCRWNLLPAVPDDLAAGIPGLSPLLVQLLYNRGITGEKAIASFLRSDASLLGDPLLLPGMDRAVARIYRALLGGEKICIFGDFDADGITATAVLVQGLEHLGGNCVPYIPHRQTEGHGLSETAIRDFKEQAVNLIVTVDCGVTDIAEVKLARKLGIDVVVTDHHAPLQTVPDAVAVVDPKLEDSQYGFTGLAGVGVAFKLLQALYRITGQEDYLDEVLDLVAIGTVADMSPPLGENRYLIRRGLEQMNTRPRLGLKALMDRTSLTPGKLDADSIGWILAPCLNAAGRLADGLTGFKLLVTTSESEARELAGWLTSKNAERQRLTAETLELARQNVLVRGLAPLLITSDKDYPSGIAGLVASRLCEEFYRPSIVINVDGETSHASCRSIPEFDIIDSLNRFSHLFDRYGGHAAAAGFSLPTKNLAQLEKELAAFVETTLAGVELQPRFDIDMVVTLPEMAGDTYRSVQQLAPFGIGNRVPVFLSRDVEVLERRTMGNNGDHLRFRLRQAGSVWTAVAFRLGKHEGLNAPLLDIVYNLEVDTWNGRQELRLNILDFRPSERKGGRA